MLFTVDKTPCDGMAYYLLKVSVDISQRRPKLHCVNGISPVRSRSLMAVAQSSGGKAFKMVWLFEVNLWRPLERSVSFLLS